MPELTPRDDAKKTVSEILKRVDQLLKAGELDAAVTQIEKAKATDPRNVYVFAYEERLNSMLQERRAKEELEAKQKAEEERRRKQEEERRREEEAKRKAEEERRRKDEEARKAEEAKRKADEERRKREEAEQHRKEDESRHAAEGREKPKVPEISREVLEATKRKILDDRKRRGIGTSLEPQPGKTFRSTYEEGLDIYRRVLMEAWADGATTPEEEEQLGSLQASLQITSADRERMEREAKQESYTQAFRRAWSSGAISPESASALADLRKKFKISMDEHEQIEAKLLWEFRTVSQKARIMIIDDDEKLLRVVSTTLQEAGFQTIPLTTTDEAFSILKDTTPDMIISDINLETSTMGGFSFYEKIREIDRLHDIPFIFLSGLTDEVLIRTGKELGVDDYITKPFSDETLIATIKGKLKRYRQLRKDRSK